MEVNITGAHFVASWVWDVKGDTCGICRKAFEAACPTCHIPGENCPLRTGMCHHTFHLHCIEKCAGPQQVSQTCPMCRQQWD